MAAQGSSNSDAATATHALTSQLQTLSICDQPSSAAAEIHPLPNLPLPRELRDQIWGYLLHHEYNHDRPYRDRSSVEGGERSKENSREKSLAHTYHFHCSILATNRQIHEEAAKVLHANSFVIFSYQMWPMDRLVHQYDLPIVTENLSHIARFKRHKLRVHFNLPTLEDDLGKLEKAHSVLMVSKDLPVLCCLLQRTLHFAPSPSIHVHHKKGAPLHTFFTTAEAYASHRRTSMLKRVKGQRPSIKLQLQEPIGHFGAQQLLSPFRSVVFGMLNIKILNCEEPLQAYAHSLERVMSPRIIWSSAMAWHVLDHVRVLNNHARNVLENGKLTDANDRYRYVTSAFELCTLFHFEPTVYDSDIARPLFILSSIMITAPMMESLLEIKIGTFGDGAVGRRLQLIDDLLTIMENIPESERGAIGVTRYLVTWHRSICYFFLERTEQTLHMTYRNMQDLVGSIPRNTIQPLVLQYIESDLRLIEFYASYPEVVPGSPELAVLETYLQFQQARTVYLAPGSPTLRTLCRSSAAGHLPVVVLDIANHDTEKPEGIEGYVDMNHYEHIRANNPELAATLMRQST